MPALDKRPSPARRAAWEALTAWLLQEPERARLGNSKRPFPPPSLSAMDRARAKTLADSAVKRHASLDGILRKLAHGRKPRPAGLHAALLLGAAELLFDAKTPARAIVHEAVQLARIAAREGGARFSNAILRSLSKERSYEHWIPSPPEGARVEELAQFHSFPIVLAERWCEAFGQEQAEVLMRCANERGQLTLRTRPQRMDREAVASRLREEGIETEPGPHPCSLILHKTESRKSGAAVLETKCFQEGLFAVCDSTSLEVVDLVDARPGLRVLDYCAAPGTKALAIADAMDGKGQVFVHDLHVRRLEGLPKELERLGLEGVSNLADRSAVEKEAERGLFDRILVDAPCTNTGVLSKRAEARWRFTRDTLEESSALQRRIVQDLVPFLAKGGRLIYSTCSIEREENEDVAEACAATSALRVISSERVLPESGLRDGGGVSIFEKLE